MLYVMAVGSLSLETVPLKNALKSEAASWKARFAQNLHAQSAEDLKAFDAYIRCAHDGQQLSLCGFGADLGPLLDGCLVPAESCSTVTSLQQEGTVH